MDITRQRAEKIFLEFLSNRTYPIERRQAGKIDTAKEVYEIHSKYYWLLKIVGLDSEPNKEKDAVGQALVDFLDNKGISEGKCKLEVELPNTQPSDEKTIRGTGEMIFLLQRDIRNMRTTLNTGLCEEITTEVGNLHDSLKKEREALLENKKALFKLIERSKGVAPLVRTINSQYGNKFDGYTLPHEKMRQLLADLQLKELIP